MHAENSEVLFEGSVAVDVIIVPTATGGRVALKLPMQDPELVIRTVDPIKVRPSPLPDGSQAALEKSSIRKLRPGLLSSVPFTTVFAPLVVAEVNTGKVAPLLEPMPAPQGRLGVTPSAFRSIPRPTFEKMELESTASPTTEPRSVTPAVPLLNAIKLPAPGTVPPIVLLLPVSAINTPLPAFPRGPPPTSEPMKFPCTRLLTG